MPEYIIEQEEEKDLRFNGEIVAKKERESTNPDPTQRVVVESYTLYKTEGGKYIMEAISDVGLIVYKRVYMSSKVEEVVNQLTDAQEGMPKLAKEMLREAALTDPAVADAIYRDIY